MLGSSPLDSWPRSYGTSFDPTAKRLKPSLSNQVIKLKVNYIPLFFECSSDYKCFHLVDYLRRARSILAHEPEPELKVFDDIVIRGPGGPYDSNFKVNITTTLHDLKLEKDTRLTLKFNDSEVDFKMIVVDITEKVADVEYPKVLPTTTEPCVVSGFEATSVKLNEMYPHFNSWAFDIDSEEVQLHLFQPGTKQAYGWIRRDDDRALFLPTKYSSLELYLHALNYAVKNIDYAFKPFLSRIRSRLHGISEDSNGFYSRVVVQRHDTGRRIDKYLEKGRSPNECETRVLPTRYDLTPLNSIFPRVATLMGCAKLVRKVPKGWLTYRYGVLSIYKCKSDTYKDSRPRWDAFDGEDLYHAMGMPILEQKVEIMSLHQLLETVEGMLETLG